MEVIFQILKYANAMNKIIEKLYKNELKLLSHIFDLILNLLIKVKLEKHHHEFFPCGFVIMIVELKRVSPKVTKCDQRFS